MGSGGELGNILTVMWKRRNTPANSVAGLRGFRRGAELHMASSSWMWYNVRVER